MSCKQHPSGRPIREGRVVARSVWRVPDDGYVTPRLRERHGAQAIGFTASLYSEADETEDRKR